jgi:aminoglycoside phosphotransferase
MDKQYEAFCMVDPIFYDALRGSEAKGDARASAGEFAAGRRPVPAGWQRERRDDWLVYGPIGARLPDQGWKIHVSACLDNAERVLDRVWAYCVARGLSFKFIYGRPALLMRNSKYAPRGSSGKFVTIYPTDDAELELVCKELADLLDGEPGPYILSDLRLDAGPVYVRYGGFAARYCVSGGQIVAAIADGDGTLVPDRRGPVFSIPDWVTLPAFLEPHLARRNETTTLDLPYQIERVIHFSNGGGLYTAVDTRSGDRVVLKEARPHAGLDSRGVDAVARLRREHDVLTALSGVDQVPRVHDRFSLGDHEFLAIGYIDAKPLNKLLVDRYPLVDVTADEQRYREYTDWALGVYEQVERTVEAIHDRGIVYGDLHLFNVLVDDAGTVTLVDFEVAGPADGYSRPGLRSQAFAAPRGRTGYDVDRYALACLRLALFLPLTSMLRLAPEKAADLAEVIAERFPVPETYLNEAVVAITTASTAVVRRQRFQPDAPGWAAVRRSVAGAIVASATPDRNDRLFPGDIEQFRTGGLNLAHGAAGVLYALAVTGAGRYPEYEDWLIQRARHPESGARLGFYDGLHGVAYALERLGRRQDALDVIETCLREPWDVLDLDLMGGLAGIGLNLLHFADATGEPELRAAARRATDLVADRLPTEPPGDISGGRHPRAGFIHGSSGPALLFLRMYETTGDASLLDLAATALRHDLHRCVVRDDGAMEVNEGWRTMPYLAEGSVGVGLVLDRYLAHRADAQFADASAAISRAAQSPLYVQSGLFAGRAGIILYLAHRHRAGEELGTQVRNLAWHALPYRGHVAFPGEQLLRLSMDLATGSAGVLLALGAALHHEPVDLPFLTPATPKLPSHREGEHPDGTRKEVSRNGSSGSAGDGTVRRE